MNDSKFTILAFITWTMLLLVMSVISIVLATVNCNSIYLVDIYSMILSFYGIMWFIGTLLIALVGSPKW